MLRKVKKVVSRFQYMLMKHVMIAVVLQTPWEGRLTEASTKTARHDVCPALLPEPLSIPSTKMSRMCCLGVLRDGT